MVFHIEKPYNKSLQRMAGTLAALRGKFIGATAEFKRYVGFNTLEQ